MAYINDRMIFYHVPKTGGKWVAEAMLKCGLMDGVGEGRFFGEKEGKKPEGRPFALSRQHSTPTAMLDRFKEGRYQFCFVRRPFEWLRSFWCHRLRTGRKRKSHFPMDQCLDGDFSQFLRNVVRERPGFIGQMYQCYVGPENNWMDFVGCYERLADDLVVALNQAGCEFDEDTLRSTPPVNVSAQNPEFGGQATAPAGLVKAVEQAESWVMETFYA
jgi:hypothetical protein